MLSNITFAILDTETTGFNADKWDKLLEIAVVKIRNWKVVREDCFETMINPQRDIPLSASRVNGITEDMVKDAPLIEDKIEEFVDFFHDVDYTLIHNAKFDLSFINHSLKQSPKKEIQDFKMPWVVCTVELSKALYPHYSAHNLDAISKRFWLAITDWELRHRALWDVILTWEVFLKFFEENPMVIFPEMDTISENYK